MSELFIGCGHYKRKCQFITPCCKKYFTCRFCHDENESHKLNRRDVTRLVCSVCGTEQEVQNKCQRCGILFGQQYFCAECRLFDDEDKQQFHCDDCGICRVGGRSNFFHCQTCDICLPVSVQYTHKCVEKISRTDCKVCLEDMHTSRIPSHIPPCGHLIHKTCYEYLKQSGCSTCPFCLQSMDISQDSSTERMCIEEVVRHMIDEEQSQVSNCSFSIMKYEASKVVTDDTLKKYPDLFMAMSGSWIFQPNLLRCPAFTGSGICNDTDCRKLHICLEYLLNSCKTKICKYGHSLHSNHNKVILGDNFLSKVTASLNNLIVWCNVKDILPGVCCWYNTTLGCTKVNSKCRGLHICENYVSSVGNCIRKNCKLSHDLNAVMKHLPGNIVRNLTKDLSSREGQSELLTALCLQQSQAGVKSNLSGDGKWVMKSSAPQEICIFNLKGSCPLGDKCVHLHTKHTFLWQVSHDDKSYLNLLSSQNEALEKAFCDPAQTTVVIEALDKKTFTPEHPLLHLLGTRQWVASFSTMTLSDGKNNLSLHRTSTPSKGNNLVSRFSTQWKWYFKNENSRWTVYGVNGNEEASEELEVAFCADQSNYSYVTSRFAYIINFVTMKQTNTSTRTCRDVLRRPVFQYVAEDHRQFQRKYLLPHWDIMPDDETYALVELNKCENYYELQEISSLFYATCKSNTVIISIKRVQNPSLWNSFESKKALLKKAYSKHAHSVQEMSLFHGTSLSAAEAICKQNFDWRLCGTNVGVKYGRGVYFAKKAHYAQYFCKKADTKIIFMAKVIVGNMVLGNSNMIRPPINSQTCLTYDTSVDNISSPSVFVKYTDNEFYPEYLIKYM